GIAILAEHSTFRRRAARRLDRNGISDPDELVQSALFELWQALVRYRAGGKKIRESGFQLASKILGNLLADAVRIGVARRTDSLEGAVDVEDPGIGPEDLESQMELLSGLGICWDQLDSQEQWVVREYALSSKSFNDIAKETGMGKDQIRGRYHRAIKKLKRCLADGGHGKEAPKQ
ncbi:MAG: sigma-70 family RNA polymerase sigma factor, partial [Planctomycetota bacterium]